MAKKLVYVVETVEKLKVEVINGHEMECQSVCQGFEWYTQGKKFQMDALILSLDNYDLILRVQWLSDLGTFTWDFKSLRM